MAFTPFSAKNAKIRCGAGAATLTAKSWTVTVEADELDVTNFESAGLTYVIGGVKKMTVQIEIDWDGQSNPFEGSLSFVAGTTLTTIKLYVNDTSGPYWSIPSLFIRSVSNPMEVRQSARVTINGTATAAGATFVYPTGTAA